MCLLGKNNNFMQFEAPNKCIDVKFGFQKSEKLCHCRGVGVGIIESKPKKLWFGFFKVKKPNL